MKHIQIETHSPEETEQFASDFVMHHKEEFAANPVLLLLEGEYGSGKTQFVKGLAKGLGIERTVVSPSFVYMRNYPYSDWQKRGELVHVDAWRVKDPQTFDLLGIKKFIVPGNLIAVEWPEEFGSRLFTGNGLEVMPVVYTVKISETGENSRKIEIRGQGVK